MRHLITLGMGALLSLSACAAQKAPTLVVANPSGFARAELAEIDFEEAAARAGSRSFSVTDSRGHAVPFQISSDGKLLLPVSLESGAKATFRLKPSDTPIAADTVACGKLYPYRQDDLAWENDVVAFRAYGPGTTKRGEKMYGYDLFLKRGTDAPVVESLYQAQCSGDNWKIVNGLHKEGRHAEADSVQNSFTYHVDHGYGMDCYAVGATLGAGAMALYSDGKLDFPGCFETAEVLENGPYRFSALLTYAPKEVAGQTLTEHRIISLDKGSNLNRTEVWYEGQTEPLQVAAGTVVRKPETALVPQEGYASALLSCQDPTQGNDNGLLQVGCVAATPWNRVEFTADGSHQVGVSVLKPGDHAVYYWGFGWDRGNMPAQRWSEYLHQFHDALGAPLKTSWK